VTAITLKKALNWMPVMPLQSIESRLIVLSPDLSGIALLPGMLLLSNDAGFFFV
jgi:hypothetical protein